MTDLFRMEEKTPRMNNRREGERPLHSFWLDWLPMPAKVQRVHRMPNCSKCEPWMVLFH